jgi:hypothetical protein
MHQRGFAREALMAWCEANRVDFLFGLARNERLEQSIQPELVLASLDSLRTGRAARRFKDFTWSTLDSWSLDRRVVGKAVTSLKSREVAAQHLYEAIYCARGEMENRIKERQLDLFADRTSAATMRANQLRLWFASMAYVLLCALRRMGLACTQFADATCGDDPPQAAEDRCPGAHQRTTDQGSDGVGLSMPGGVRAGACAIVPRGSLIRTRHGADQIHSNSDADPVAPVELSSKSLGRSRPDATLTSGPQHRTILARLLGGVKILG